MIKKVNYFIKLMRPTQWVKNLFVLSPIFFSYHFLNLDDWKNTFIAFVCFILSSSAVYVFNDIIDITEDRSHPRKKLRPLAAGKVSPVSAGVFCVMLIIANFILALNLPFAAIITITIYLIMQLAYTLALKRQAIFDVLIIAAGFVLRVVMGGHSINVPISPWIILTTYLLALFLGFGKRYHELSIEGYGNKRKSLKRYNKPLLDRLIGISCVSALLSYAMYTVETARLLNKTEFVYTVVFVIFGLFRYLQVLYIDEKGGEPEKILLHDKIFLGNGIVWFIFTMLILLNW
jgi:4-hydroxybenzoate polyprenyltransferase